MSRCVRSFVLFSQLALAVFSVLPDGSRAQGNASDYLPPLSAAVDVQGRRMASGATWSPSSRASSPSPVQLMNIPTLKEASDPYANRRPRRNVSLLPILALLDLSSMETNRGQMDGDSSFDGTSLLKTAQMAVAHVNARQLIPGFHLHLLVNDSKVSCRSPLIARAEYVCQTCISIGRPVSGAIYIYKTRHATKNKEA